MGEPNREDAKGKNWVVGEGTSHKEEEYGFITEELNEFPELVDEEP